MEEKGQKFLLGSIENDWSDKTVYREQVVKNYLVAAILTSSLATTATSVGSLASMVAKKVKDGSLVVIWKYQGKALNFFFF